MPLQLSTMILMRMMMKTMIFKKQQQKQTTTLAASSHSMAKLILNATEKRKEKTHHSMKAHIFLESHKNFCQIRLEGFSIFHDLQRYNMVFAIGDNFVIKN